MAGTLVLRHIAACAIGRNEARRAMSLPDNTRRGMPRIAGILIVGAIAAGFAIWWIGGQTADAPSIAEPAPADTHTATPSTLLATSTSPAATSDEATSPPHAVQPFQSLPPFAFTVEAFDAGELSVVVTDLRASANLSTPCAVYHRGILSIFF
jgi:hypothetical protein